MRHEEYKEALALDALDSLGEPERRALREHLLSCPECREELREMRDTVASLAYTVTPVAPSEALRTRIFAQVHNLAQERTKAATETTEESVARESGAQVVAMPPLSERGGNAARWRSMFTYGAIAASLLIAALLVWLGLLWQQNREMRSEMARLAEQSNRTQEKLARQLEETARERDVRELLTAPDARIMQLAGTKMAEQARGRMALDPATGHAILIAYNLPPAPAGKAYQLWFIKGGKPMPGGVFKTDNKGGASMRDQVPAEGRDASTFAVTLEREQGESAPKGEMYLLSSAS